MTTDAPASLLKSLRQIVLTADAPHSVSQRLVEASMHCLPERAAADPGRANDRGSADSVLDALPHPCSDGDGMIINANALLNLF